jgi:hypothetical protein
LQVSLILERKERIFASLRCGMAGWHESMSRDDGCKEAMHLIIASSGRADDEYRDRQGCCS